MKTVITILSKGVNVNYVLLPEKDLKTKTLHQLNHKNRIKQIIYGEIFTYYHDEMDFTHALNNGCKIILDERGKF